MTSPTSPIDAVAFLIDTCAPGDQGLFRRRLHGISLRLRRSQPIDRALASLANDIEGSRAAFASKRPALPTPTFDESLPVVQRRDEIAKAIQKHQVIVICGETGSGKTTQLPKICLTVGRGIHGMIGHTQPRRIAARTVASRIAQEMNTPLGQVVGYKVRFGDQVSSETRIKLMTDGILLAETQSDRMLKQYDTIIIDEAHERGLNIDFLLGYIKLLLPRRPDLKVIITSATIDPQRFSDHFDKAPIIEVSGRTYPVETRYRPRNTMPGEEDRTVRQSIIDAVDELAKEAPGDVLVFLSGEREIRETAEAMRKHHSSQTHILPLYARLSNEEQNRVFQPHGGRRIVLATNVAETSLTVPGIRYVVDPGDARISRYSSRTKVQRLPIEAISKASADQRKGRCGRVGPGICIRLYGEQDFITRDQFTQPEILRTNLASVILQMKFLRLGEVEKFPFVEPPTPRMIKDGYATLHELGAVDEKNELTQIGRKLARMPVDPRIARMVLAAQQENCLREMLVLASALSVQDPRDRPMEHSEKADTCHRQYADPNSDFLGYIKLWDTFHAKGKELSSSKLRAWCKANFLSFVRMREWHDVYMQLKKLVIGMEAKKNPELKSQTGGSGGASGGESSRPRRTDDRRPRRDDRRGDRNPRNREEARPNEVATPRPALGDGVVMNEKPADFDSLHRALLTGLLGNIGTKSDKGEKGEFSGARNSKFFIFPGSGLFKKPPQWVMAAEVVETSRLYARTVAKINPQWVERLAGHLLNKTYSEPHWHAESAHVMAYEKVLLYGLTLVNRRPVHFGPVDPKTAREMFIMNALVECDFDTDAPFFTHNQDEIEAIRTLEAKSRQSDLLTDSQTRYAFYDARIPKDIYDGPRFETWRKEAERKNPRLLFMTREILLAGENAAVAQNQFPDHIMISGLRLELSYHHEPGHASDGVTATVRESDLSKLDPRPAEWLVSGMLREKVIELIRSLPTAHRKNFVPAPQFADELLTSMKPGEGSLLDQMSAHLEAMTTIVTPREMWQTSALPVHLLMNFQIVDDRGKQLAIGRDIETLQQRLESKPRDNKGRVSTAKFTRDNLTTWDFGDLPERLEVGSGGQVRWAYPALVDRETAVSLMLLDSPADADSSTRAGIRRLFLLANAREIKSSIATLPLLQPMLMHFTGLGTAQELKDELTFATIDRTFMGDQPPIRTAMEFELRQRGHASRIYNVSREVAGVVAPILQQYHALALRFAQPIPPTWATSVNDIRTQLFAMLAKGFISRTNFGWLSHYPRYVSAVNVRLNKLANGNLDRDLRATREISPLWQQYLDRAQKLRLRSIADPNLEMYRWMLEEFRVASYAQELGVAMPVSLQRLEKQWALVRV